jgi:hypothetical protein
LRIIREEEIWMPVLITAVVPGQTREGYDQAMLVLKPLLDQAKGLIAHGAGMSPEAGASSKSG